MEYKYEIDKRYSKVCKTCGTKFYKKKCSSLKIWENRIFCSLKCRRNGKGKPKNRVLLEKPIIVYCKNCGNRITIKTYSERKKQFCSVSCSSKYSQKERNYWNDERREAKSRSMKMRVLEGKWINPIFCPNAKEKMIQTKNKKPVTFNKSRIELASKLAAERLINGKNENLGSYKFGKMGYFYSNKNTRYIKYRSNYEKRCYEILENLDVVTSYESEPFRIEYIVEGIKRNYIPDLLVTYLDGTKKLIEVKPISKLYCKDTLIKKLYADNYCKDNNINSYEIWTETILFPNRRNEI